MPETVCLALQDTSHLPIGTLILWIEREGTPVCREESKAPFFWISLIFDITVVAFAPFWELTVYLKRKSAIQEN